MGISGGRAARSAVGGAAPWQQATLDQDDQPEQGQAEQGGDDDGGEDARRLQRGGRADHEVAETGAGPDPFADDRPDDADGDGDLRAGEQEGQRRGR